MPKKILKAQATLEFTFGILVAVMLLMGMVQILIWSGHNLVERRQSFEEHMMQPNLQGWEQTRDVPYHLTSSMNIAVAGNIFGYDDGF